MNKQEYAKFFLDLIYLEQQVEKTWARCDLKVIKDLRDIIKFYQQFEER